MSSDVRQCRECRRLFQSLGSNICPECAEELDRCFKVVKSYLYDHPDANVFEISTETGVAEKMVLNFLKEGRLAINEADSILLCERCGIPVSTGRYCRKCQEQLEDALNGALKTDPAKRTEAVRSSAPGRMHVNLHG